MSWPKIKEQAREKLRGICRLCPNCDGRSCAGEVTGIGGVGTGSSFINNYEALRKIHLNLDALHSVTDPSLKTRLFGHSLAFPILGAAVAGCKINFQGRMNEDEFCLAQVQGAHEAGTVALTGDAGHAEVFAAGIKAAKAVGGASIPIIKPREVADIVARIREAEEAGAIAVGIDIDAAGLVNMRLLGQPVGPLSLAELKSVCRSTELPVIIKGVMTPKAALLAYEAGARAVVVSNHGGRALDHTPGTATVLPEIAQAVRGRLAVMADGGVRSGVDVLKFLSLGADVVLVGRPLVWAVFGGGVEGVKTLYTKLAEELKTAMILTGCPNPSQAGKHLLAIS